MTEQIKFRKSDAIALLFSIFIPGLGQIYLDKLKNGIIIIIVWAIVSFLTFDNLILMSIELTPYGYVIDLPRYFGPYIWLILTSIIWFIALINTKQLIDQYNDSN